MCGKDRSDAPAVPGKMSVSIDLATFERRFKNVCKFLTEQKLDALTVVLGPTDENVTESEASAFFHWLLGFEFPDTLIAITANSISFLSSKKKIQILEQLSRFSLKCNFFIRDKNDESLGYASVVSSISSCRRVGKIARTTGQDFATDWLAFAERNTNEFVSVQHISQIWCLKEKQEIDYIIYASQLCEVLLSDVVFENLKKNFFMSHSLLESKVFEGIETKSSGISGILPRGESVDYFEIYGVTIHQHKFFWNVEITCKYKSYMATVARIFISSAAPTEMREKLNQLNECRSLFNRCLKTGLTSKQIFQDICKSMEKIENIGSDFERYFGQSIGLCSREDSFCLSESLSSDILVDGMTICVSMGITIEGSAIRLKDTCFIKGGVLQKTVDIFESFTSVIIEATAVQTSKPTLRTKKTVDYSSEQTVIDHQKALAKKICAESLERYRSLQDGLGTSAKGKSDFGVCYQSEKNLPILATQPSVFLDKKKEALIVPIAGVPVPFHILTVKTANKVEEGDISLIRFNFSLPTKDSSETIRNFHFIKSVTVRFRDHSSAAEVIKEFNDFKKWMSQKEAESSLKKDLAAPAKLLELPGKRVKLTDVFMRPGFDGKRVPGDVEIYSNGLRYIQLGKSDSSLDIMFDNIKHLYFQSCRHEMVVLIHLNLVSPILIGKKKMTDVQFYREALDSLVDETSGRRKKLRLGDEDEIMQEAEERKRRKEADAEFKLFAQKISEVSKVLLVEEPFRELGFTGVPHRQTVLLQPTAESLVFLSEPPFLVVTLSEIEIVYFERIVFGLRNFDMVFVNKDHSIPPVHVTSIPVSSLEPVKKWLNEMDMLFAETAVNYNWPNIMKTINEDPVGFYEMGGWSYLQPGQDSDSEQSEVESEYEEDEDEDDVSEEYEEDEDEYEEESEASEEDSAPDWDELEEEAMEEDDRKGKKDGKRK